MAKNEQRIQQLKQLISKTTPATKKAQDAIVFLKRIHELEEKLKSLLQGSLVANMTVFVCSASKQPLINTIEEIESQPDLISDHLMVMIQDARMRVRQFAASLIEPDV